MSYSNFSAVSCEQQKAIERKSASTELVAGSLPEAKRHSQPEPPMSADVQTAVFRREGEYWSVGPAETPIRLRDSKGLTYIAYLLRHPGTAFHALDLTSGIAGDSEEKPAARQILGQKEFEREGFQIGGLGDAGEVLDDQAKRAYRQRLSELREELEEAKSLGKAERADELEAEIDALTHELTRAVGLGGRSRRAAAASQRARQAVRKAIKAALDRISHSNAEFGRLFSQCIKTGHFCSYHPKAASPIKWQFAEIEPSPRSTSDNASTPAELSSMALEFLPFSAARRTAFVNRESECRAIEAAIADARGGRGSLMMVGGGPGVGKTRLAVHMAEYASHLGFTSFIGRCNERQEPVPFLPFVEIIETMLARAASLDAFRNQIGANAPEMAQLAPSLRRVFQDIPEPVELPDRQKRHYIFQSVTEALARAARTRPHLFILDDLQWADESTLAFLNHLTDHLGQVPLAVIATYRDELFDENSAFARTLEELIRRGVRPLRLSGLSKDSVTRMLDDLSQQRIVDSLVDAIFEESDGNPFFVEEVYRHLLDEGKIFDSAGRLRTDLKIDEIEVPENVRLILARRLKRFSDREMGALSAAAVIGRSFSFQLLAVISQIEINELFAAIEKAQRMGIIVPSAQGPEKPFAFAHELVRQALLAEISIARRQQLHARAGAEIELLYPAAVKEHAGEIVNHLLKGGSFASRDALVRSLTEAGNAALEAAAFEEARAHFELALSRLDKTDLRQRAKMLERIGTAYWGLERPDEAILHLREALGICIDLDDRQMIATAYADLADALRRAAQNQEAIDLGRRALASLEIDDGPERVRLLAAVAEALTNSASYEPAQEVIREALGLASKLSDPELESRLLTTRALLNFWLLRLREVADDVLRSEPLAISSPKAPWERVIRWNLLLEVLTYLGRLEEAERIADQLEPLAKKVANPLAVANCHWKRAWSKFGREPDLSKLEADLQESSPPEHVQHSPHWEFLSHLQLAIVEFHRGNWDRAMSHCQACFRLEAGVALEGVGTGLVFKQLAYAGDRDQALAIFHEKRAHLPVSGEHNPTGSWWMLAPAIEGLFVLGERSQAGELYPLVRELLDKDEVLFACSFRFTHTIAGIAAAGAGQYEASQDHFRIALEQAESIPFRFEKAEISRFHALMLLVRGSTGDRATARALLAEALNSYTRFGMPRHAELTRELLGRTD